MRLPTYVGEVDGTGDVRLREDLRAYDCRNNRLAQMALERDGFAAAVDAARDRYGPHRVAVFLGTSTSGILETELAYRRRVPSSGALPADFNFDTTHCTAALAGFVRRFLRLEGPSAVISSACATTAKVFANAARMIEAGLCDAAVVGGADSLSHTTLYGFHSLELVAEGPCRPFDAARDGVSIGEGAGFALLERADAPSAPGSVAFGSVALLGVGESNDAYHMSTPHPDGIGARLAMERALAAAGLSTGAIDYINLHGTATRTGDAAEDRAVTDLFGTETPCSSTKGHTGHMLGASGITEAIIAALCIQHGLMPGGLHTRTIDPALKSHYLLAGRSGRVDRVMSNSFGFGGTNCSLILGRAG